LSNEHFILFCPAHRIFLFGQIFLSGCIEEKSLTASNRLLNPFWWETETTASFDLKILLPVHVGFIFAGYNESQG
jgi:hypothetical protein